MCQLKIALSQSFFWCNFESLHLSKRYCLLNYQWKFNDIIVSFRSIHNVLEDFPHDCHDLVYMLY